MIQVIGCYLAATGGVAAGAQVLRGAVRGTARLVRGDPRGALVEVAGGLAAPVFSAVHQLSRLGREVCESATALTAEARQKFRPATAPSAPHVPRRRGRKSPVPTVNGVA